MITRIQIERFKSLRHTEWLKMGQVTLLTGANGRGKSSFCQCLLVVSQTWRRGMMESLLPAGAWKDLGSFSDMVYAYGEDKTIDIHIITDVEKDNDFELLYSQSIETPTLGTLQEVMVGGKPITDDSSSEEDEAEETDDRKYDGDDIQLGSLRDFPSLMALERMYYVAAERRAASALQPIDETTPHNYLAPDGSNVLNVLWKNLETGCVQEVNQLLKVVLDGGDMRIEKNADSLVLSINSVEDGHYFQPVNVGYGYSYILSLLSAVVLAPANSFIIVENPEAHLHPSAQAKVMNVMIDAARKRKLQLIVETHSDHVLNTALRAVNEKRLALDELEVLFFSKGQDEKGNVEARVQNLEINERGHILTPPKLFFEQYSLDLRALYSPTNR